MNREQSEAVEVWDDKPFYFIEGPEIFKNSVFEYRVELVLDRGQDGCLLILIDSRVVEVLVPVELEEVEQLKLVKNLAHTSLYLGFVEVGVVLPGLFAS